MTFKYSNKEYEIEIIKKNNKNTYIRVKNNKIYITTNYFTSTKTIQKLLIDNYKSIEKLIEKSIKKDLKKDLFLLFGQPYDIIYDDLQKKPIITENYIKIANEKTLTKWLDQYIYTTFYEHLMYWYNTFEEKIPHPNLKIRKMTSRWGVCNIKNKNITLNKELIKYDINCLDYVIIHELSHFLEPNHSKKFWTIVEKYCPDYKNLRKKLKN